MDDNYSLRKTPSQKIFAQILWHSIYLLILFTVLILIRLPILANADMHLNGDEGFMASDMADLFRGGAFSFYHDNVSYHGVIHSLFAIPFFTLLGVNSLAFKLPATLYYALYIWSFFLLARRLNHRLSWIVTILLVVCPPSILERTHINLPHFLACSLSNLAFLIFLEYRDNPSPSKIFWVFLIMGISFYTYTFSIIYLLSLLIIWALSLGLTFGKIWEHLRPSTSRETFARIIDIFLLIYFSGILLSFIAGGIVLTVNNFNILTFFMYLDKPYIGGLNSKLLYPAPFLEFVLLAVLRIIFYRKDIDKAVDFVKASTTLKLGGYGLLGFFIGLTPRWMGLADKQVSGHAGFEVNIHPLNIFNKIVDLVQTWLPRLFHLSFSEYLVPSIFMSILLLGSSVYFISNWIKNFQSKKLTQ